MTQYSIDVAYAWTQIGVTPGATLWQIRDALADARRYRFVTRTRLELVRRFVDFFEAREQFGTSDIAFNDIRRAWHKKVKALHPDKNESDLAAEDMLKLVNAAYEIVDKIHREAKDYYKKSDNERATVESEARLNVINEARAAGRQTGSDTTAAEEALRQAREAGEDFDATTAKNNAPFTDAWGRAAVKFMAASVPRYIRHARLYHLPRQAIIGSRQVMYKSNQSLVYDIIMLPEPEFRRARTALGMEGHGSPELAMSRLTPAYVPMDTRMVVVPEDVADPWLFAQEYFIDKFGLKDAATAMG